MPRTHTAGQRIATPQPCPATTLLREFLNRFRYELEHDQPIQGSDAVDAISELYRQTKRQKILTHQHSSTTAARRTTQKRLTHSQPQQHVRITTRSQL